MEISREEKIRKTPIRHWWNKWTKLKLERKIGEWIKKKEYGTGDVLWPLRVALSGQKNSPGPYEIAEVLGKEETIKRINLAIEKIVL